MKHHKEQETYREKEEMQELSQEAKTLFENGVTKFTQVYATRNKEGKTAADCLCDDFMPHFGIPGKVLHDQGKEFDSDLLKQLAQLYNIKRLRTSPYHPQTNSQTGRINWYMLKVLAENNKTTWKYHIQKIFKIPQ